MTQFSLLISLFCLIHHRSFSFYHGIIMIFPFYFNIGMQLKIWFFIQTRQMDFDLQFFCLCFEYEKDEVQDIQSMSGKIVHVVPCFLTCKMFKENMWGTTVCKLWRVLHSLATDIWCCRQPGHLWTFPPFLFLLILWEIFRISLLKLIQIQNLKLFTVILHLYVLCLYYPIA